MMDKHKNNNKRGVSVYLAIFCLLLFSSLALVVCSLISTHTKTATDFLAEQQALHIAEAGAQYSVWYLVNTDPYWTTAETTEKSLGGGTYTLEVYDDAITGEKVVISRGYLSQKSNYQAMRQVNLRGTFGINAAANPIYKYAIYTDSTNPDSGVPLLFDANNYTLTTSRVSDGNANVHSNHNVTFWNGSGWVVDGYAYSAKNIIVQNWTGNPWRRGMAENQPFVTPPYLNDVAKNWYRARAQAQGRYYSGNKTFTGLVELGSPTVPALIFVEGSVKIGSVTYHRPGNTGLYGVGTIVSGGGDISIAGYIIPASGTRNYLALVSFYDTKYHAETLPIDEPPYNEGSRRLNIYDDSNVSKITFNNEYITVSYRANPWDWNSRYGWLTVYRYDNLVIPVFDVAMTRSGSSSTGYLFTYRFPTSSLPISDWYYFRVQVCRNSNRTGLRNQTYAYFINDSPPAPQHYIRCYLDAGFTQETSQFDDSGTVYLKIYAETPTTTISEIELSDYTLNTDYPSWSNETNNGTYITCEFTLPALTTAWWYSLRVTTFDGCQFTKQVYINPLPQTPDIYACSHSNNYFRLQESADPLNFYGNLTARHGILISTTVPQSNITVVYDANRFRRNLGNVNALPGSVTFNYTWKED